MNALMSKKKVRATHTKSKTGCRTCKIRRVKCDESRPSCKNCCSTGRKCDGYGIWNTVTIPASTTRETTPTVITIYPQSRGDIPLGTSNINVFLTLPKLSDEEKMCFDYFRSTTITKIPGVFYSHFWHKLVLQACVSEPAVLHAVIALGSAHRIDDESLRFRWIDGKSHDSKEIRRRQVFTIQEYSKAISHLRNRKIEDGSASASLRVVIITCVLFVTLDLLRGEFGNAQTHTASGWKLMKELRSGETGCLADQSQVDLSSDCTSVDESLSESLACLSVQSALFGCKTATSHLEVNQPAHLSEAKMPSSFRNMSEARRSFNILLGDVLALTQDCRSFDFGGTPYPTDLRTRQVCLQSAIASWKMVYSRSRETITRQSHSMHAVVGVYLLRVFLSMTSILAETALCGGQQMLFDDYTSHFTSILTQTLFILNFKVQEGSGAATSTKETSPDDMAGEFIADVGILPFMYYTAIKCRVPWLRRQAIALLLATPIREGMWDNFVMANVARRVVTLEENGFYDTFTEEIEPGPHDSPVENNERLKHIPPLPESSRFYDVELQMYDPLKGSGKLILRRRKNDEEGGWEEVASDFDFSGLKKGVYTGCDSPPLDPDQSPGSSRGVSAAK
ncbi:hypothetical protein BKA61DRAFT_742571 [Leptodontidium sp. MPI-SDFR-AT-0119]|nr:hypothetical protein BKA61DRAFT_742571 [Leptodontidium sp. MPI-SDFR-AT-0119]